MVTDKPAVVLGEDVVSSNKYISVGAYNIKGNQKRH